MNMAPGMSYMYQVDRDGEKDDGMSGGVRCPRAGGPGRHPRTAQPAYCGVLRGTRFHTSMTCNIRSSITRCMIPFVNDM